MADDEREDQGLLGLGMDLDEETWDGDAMDEDQTREDRNRRDRDDDSGSDYSSVFAEQP